MKINTGNNFSHSIQKNTINRSQIKPLQCDVVSFSAMKKSQFSGIDLYVVNRFKAPIEKFNTNDDFQEWCLNKALKDYSYEKFRSDDKGVNRKRKEMINEWQNYIQNENDDYNNAVLLMAMQGVTKYLKSKNHELPLSLNKGVLAKTIFEIKQEIEERPNIQFDFNKLYSANLSNHFIEDETPISDMTGWVIIPSKKHDMANFKENVEKVRALSNKTWCTKTNNAQPYLSEGDFHIYLENGYPKLGVRFIKNKVREVQGDLNNGTIPFKYAGVCLEHIADFKLDFDVQQQIEDIKRRQVKLEQIKQDLADAIEKNDVKEILGYFDIKVEKYHSTTRNEADEGKELYEISHFSAIHEGITFADIGIDENKLFEKIRVINGTADFAGSELTDFGELEQIIGDAKFEKSHVKDLKNIRYIAGDLELKNSNVRTLGDLTKIDGNVDFEHSRVVSLGNVERIGGNVRFTHSQIPDLAKLKYIGGSANFMECKIKDYGDIEYIGGQVIDFDGRYVTNTTANAIGNALTKLVDFFKGLKK